MTTLLKVQEIGKLRYMIRIYMIGGFTDLFADNYDEASQICNLLMTCNEGSIYCTQLWNVAANKMMYENK